MKSNVPCSHQFPSTTKCKPILSLQVYDGGLFEMIDDAIAYVMQHIDAHVGTHITSSVEVKYEIPFEVVTEAIVNACAHRDYLSNASVQVEIYPDRIEISNPGELPRSLTIEKLKIQHKSDPNNPTLAKPMYLAGYIENMGTGTTDMIRICKDSGLRAPEYELDNYGFTTTLWRKNKNEIKKETNENTDSDEATNSLENKLTEKQKQRYRTLIETIIRRPTATREEIAEEIGMSVATIRRDLNKLRKSIRIEWVGSVKTGHWEVETLNNYKSLPPSFIPKDIIEQKPS